jgi:release factor glutamine methyltransferase
MPVSPSFPSLDALVVRLRGAGCVFAEEEARLLHEAARTPEELDAMVERRAAGLPLEQVLGWAEFCGLRIAVEPGVFVPRRRTELLARQAALIAARPRVGDRIEGGPDGRPGGQRGGLRGGRRGGRPVVVDLCCGTGAVAAVVLAAVAQVDVHAADIDPVAVRCARRNLAGRGEVHQGDLYEPLPLALRGRVDVLVANAPYVPRDAIALMPPEARDHEPRTALDGGTDGLDLQRRVVAEATGWLAPGGHLLIETSVQQASGTVAAYEEHGLVARVLHDDDLDGTVVIGSRP